MTVEIRETKEVELEDIESSIEGLKYLLKQKKVHRKRLRKELKYIIDDDGILPNIKKVIEEMKISQLNFWKDLYVFNKIFY